MPLYSYKCPDCGAVEDQYSPVSARNDNIPTCHGSMQRQLSTSFVSVQPDINAQSPIDGSAITGHRQRIEHMKRNGLQEALPAKEMVRRANERKRALQYDAKKLPQLPQHLQKQLYEQAGFPG